MTDWSTWLAYRLGELLCHSTILLAMVSLLLPWIGQPTRRMVLCRGALMGLALLVVLPGIRGRAAISLPDWARVVGPTFHERPIRLQPASLESEPIAVIKREPVPSSTTKRELKDDDLPVVHSTDTGADLSGAQPDESTTAADDGSDLRVALGGHATLLARDTLLPSDSFTEPTPARPWPLVASVSWFFGALGATIWISIGAWRTGRLVRHSQQAPEWIHGELNLVVPERRRPPQLRVTNLIESALACGIFRSAILLPESTEQSAQPIGRNGIRAVLAHEWAHIAHGDLWLLAFERLLLPLYFAQPLFWLLRRRIRIDQELLADAAAAGKEPVAYAEALLAWAKSTPGRPRGEVLAVLSFWNNPCHLPRRIEMLLDTTHRIVPRASRLWRGTALTALFALTSALSLITFSASSSIAQNQTESPVFAQDSSANAGQASQDSASPAPARVAGPLPVAASSDDNEGRTNPTAADAGAEKEATLADEKYQFIQRLAKKGYTSQREVDAARAELERAKAALEAAQKKAAEAAEIDELRKLVDELREENRRLRQKLPKENSTEPIDKDITSPTDNAIELQLLELDVNEAEVDVAAAREEFDATTRLNAKGVLGTGELNIKKVALQKAEIALQRAKLRAKAAQRPSAKSGHPTPAANLPKDKTNPRDGAAKQENRTEQRQIMLNAQVVDIDRAALESLRTKFAAQTGPGSLGQFFSDMSLDKRTTLTAILESRQLAEFREAIQSDPKSRILAEPRITLRSGEKAGFSSMREFKVPMAKEKITDSAQDFTLRGVGFALSAIATIQDRDLIRLQLLPEFSAIDPSQTVDGVPGINTRRVQTTVELRSGQTIILAGLMPRDAKGNSSRIPVLSELPVAGKLFEKRDPVDDSELLILVTPEIVQTSSLRDQAAKPNRKPAIHAVNSATHAAPARRLTMARGLGDPSPLLATLSAERFSLDEENRVLTQWNAATAKIGHLEVEFARYVFDAASQVETRSEGILTFESPRQAGYLLLPANIGGTVSKKIGNDRSPFTLQTESHEHGWIWTGQDVVHVDMKSRTYERSRFPADGASKTSGPEFLLARPFVLGLPAAELREQFDIALIKKTASEFWLSFVPRNPEMKQTFSRAILVLDGATWLPKALKLTDDGGHVETIHTFLRFAINGAPRSEPNLDESKLADAGYSAIATPITGISPQAAFRRVVLPSLVEEATRLAQRRLGLAVATEPVRSLPPILAGKFRGGLRVVSTEPNGPADAAGIRAEDVLVGINVWETARCQDLKYALTNWKAEGNQNGPATNGALRLTLLRGTEALTADLKPRP
ncbi:MAG TPA: M56 family metallopeptidase [Planctomycetaceae bacterium]|jgi:beta-lactamase regulating signal transducer with metallopeptidase domain